MAEVETLSPWWRRSAIVTIVLCFCVLGWLAKLTYSGAPPIPERVVGPDGAVLFTDRRYRRRPTGLSPLRPDGERHDLGTRRVYRTRLLR